jgi:hypothetical protein
MNSKRSSPGVTPGGFPHSDISGSKLARSSPKHFAACHVLHRLLAPRHPPHALSSLTYFFTRPARGWTTHYVTSDFSSTKSMLPDLRLISPRPGRAPVRTEVGTTARSSADRRPRRASRTAVRGWSAGVVMMNAGTAERFPRSRRMVAPADTTVKARAGSARLRDRTPARARIRRPGRLQGDRR